MIDEAVSGDPLQPGKAVAHDSHVKVTALGGAACPA